MVDLEEYGNEMDVPAYTYTGGTPMPPGGISYQD